MRTKKKKPEFQFSLRTVGQKLTDSNDKFLLETM